MSNERIIARRRCNRRGASTVEAAIVLPLVFLFLFGILEYGRYVMMLQIATNAAREGAHYAVTHTNPITISGVTYGNGTSDVVNTVNTAMGGQSALRTKRADLYLRHVGKQPRHLDRYRGRTIDLLPDHRELPGDVGPNAPSAVDDPRRGTSRDAQ